MPVASRLSTGLREMTPSGTGSQLMLSAMARAATAPLGTAEAKTVPRVGYLVYRVERRLRARLDEELRLLGVSTPE